jgi:uroporphyrinogen III methyltransferase/synthase
VDYVPEKFNAKALADGLPQAGRTLLFRAQDGTPELASSLRTRGFHVDDVAAYKTIRESAGAEDVKAALTRGEFDFVMFTSASTVQGFTSALPGFDCSGLTAACIGEETAAEARKFHFRILISEKATIESMIELIRRNM